MFRKRTKKPGKNLRRKRTDESEANNDDDEDDAATAIAIRKTMKKQKILASLPLTSSIPKGKSENGLSSDAKQAPAAGTAAPELSVLATKHVRNMEAYIEEKMAATQGSSDNHKPTSFNEAQDSSSNGITSEEELYRQLAREVTDAGVDQDQKNGNSQQQAQNDGDQGDGGAALLVGTGIAEVILPTTQHKPVALPTNRVYNKNNSMLSSAVPEGERHKHVLSNTTPKPFVKFQRNTGNATSAQNNEGNPTSNHVEDTKQETLESATGSNARQGFDAFRGRTPAPDTSAEGDTDSRNSKHSNNRWKTGKDRDDQVYSQFLKNALNGKRR